MRAVLQSPAVALVWSRYGPYQFARLRAAGALFKERGLRVVGLGVAPTNAEHPWVFPEGLRAPEIRTVFPDSDYQSLAPRRIRRAVRAALSEIGPRAVAVPGWAKPEALGGLHWCRASGAVCLLMSDSNRADARRSVLKESVKARVARLFDAALVGGTPQADYAVELGVPPERVFPGYDVVDNAHFASGAAAARRAAERMMAEHSLPRRYFLIVARFIEVKNLARLLEAYRLYRDRAGGEPWDLVVCGAGPLGEELKSLATRLALQGVHWPGFASYEDLPACYGLASAFILPSLKDTWGLVVNEAMAAGLPVLVSDRVGCRHDLVEDGGNGFPFDPGDVDDMASKMLHMAALSDEERARMGRRSAEIIAAWGPGRFAAGLWSCYESAIAAPRRAGVLSRLAARGLPLLVASGLTR